MSSRICALDAELLLPEVEELAPPPAAPPAPAPTEAPTLLATEEATEAATAAPTRACGSKPRDIRRFRTIDRTPLRQE